MRTYLDHAATSPLRPEVVEQVAADLRDGVPGANPASLHSGGRRAGALLAQARARLAAALDVDPHEVLLTSGGTEADSLVVTGRVLAARDEVERPVVVVSPTEHAAVLGSARVAARDLGAELRLLEVDQAGVVVPESLERALAPGGVALVSVMTANNETGVVQDVAGLVGLVRASSGGARPGEAGHVPVHSDVVAALGRVPVRFDGWGLDAMSLSGHKLGAPVGVGALVARRDLVLRAAGGGGLQERGLRSGTQDVVGARALALAVELAVAERQAEDVRLAALRERLLAGALTLPGARATLPQDVAHLPGTAHLWFEQVDGEALLMALDLAGVDASAGSACHAGVAQPSHVMLAMGHTQAAARATLRCSMGPATTAEDVDRLLAALPGAVETARRAWSAPV